MNEFGLSALASYGSASDPAFSPPNNLSGVGSFWVQRLNEARPKIEWVFLIVNIVFSSTFLTILAVALVINRDLRRLFVLFLTWVFWLSASSGLLSLRLVVGSYHFLRISLDLLLFVFMTLAMRVICSFQCARFRLRSSPEERLLCELEMAETYSEWLRFARQLDDLRNATAWRETPESDLFEWKGLEDHLRSLRSARAEGDTDKLRFLLRLCSSRDFCGVSNPLLYSRALAGTKRLIEEFTDEMCLALADVCKSVGSEGRSVNGRAVPITGSLEEAAAAREWWRSTTQTDGDKNTEEITADDTTTVPAVVQWADREQTNAKSVEPEPLHFFSSGRSVKKRREQQCWKEFQPQGSDDDVLPERQMVYPSPWRRRTTRHYYFATPCLMRVVSRRLHRLSGCMRCGCVRCSSCSHCWRSSANNRSRYQTTSYHVAAAAAAANQLAGSSPYIDDHLRLTPSTCEVTPLCTAEVTPRAARWREMHSQQQQQSRRSEESPSVSPPDNVFKFLASLRLSFGRTALCLSGGGSLAMYHVGVVRALLYLGCLPWVISGTSGGSIVAGVAAIYTDEELLQDILQPDIVNRYKGVRWFPPLSQQIRRFFAKGQMMDGEEFRRTCEAYFSPYTFKDAFLRTGIKRDDNDDDADAVRGRLVSIVVTPSGQSGGEPMILNHINSPDVFIWSAVTASCSLPGLLPPHELVARGVDGLPTPFYPAGIKWVDGSLMQDIPVKELASSFNVKQFIVSQVNPHHAPFVATYSTESRLMAFLENWLTLDIKSRYAKLAKFNMIPRIFAQNISSFWMLQVFEGHVTITPRASLIDWYRMVNQPSLEDMQDFILKGMQRTWPHSARITQMLRIEQAVRTCWVDLVRRMRKTQDQATAS